MTIEISRNMKWVYRVNPWNGRVIDRKPNKHRGRWEWYKLCESAEAARAALLKLEKKSK